MTSCSSGAYFYVFLCPYCVSLYVLTVSLHVCTLCLCVSVFQSRRVVAAAARLPDKGVPLNGQDRPTLPPLIYPPLSCFPEEHMSEGGWRAYT